LFVFFVDCPAYSLPIVAADQAKNFIVGHVGIRPAARFEFGISKIGRAHHRRTVGLKRNRPRLQTKVRTPPISPNALSPLVDRVRDAVKGAEGSALGPMVQESIEILASQGIVDAENRFKNLAIRLTAAGLPWRRKGHELIQLLGGLRLKLAAGKPVQVILEVRWDRTVLDGSPEGDVGEPVGTRGTREIAGKRENIGVKRVRLLPVGILRSPLE